MPCGRPTSTDSAMRGASSLSASLSLARSENDLQAELISSASLEEATAPQSVTRSLSIAYIGALWHKLRLIILQAHFSAPFALSFVKDSHSH